VATVVAITDRGAWVAPTDNIVVADPRRRRLTWVPRDLWVESIRDRVNRAFYRGGGHQGLIAALLELGLEAEHTLCLRREATEAAAARLTVTVPVEEPLEYRYPLTPTGNVHVESKVVRFDPPAETLEGERIHQWIGARIRVRGAGSDLDRIERQKVFVRALLEQGFDFSSLLAEPEYVDASSDACVAELARVRPDWAFETLGPSKPETIDGMMVLVLTPPRRRARSWRR
jgi:hypothetical protein